MADITRYVTLNLPIPLAKEVDKIIHNPINGYRSRNEFCMEAIRIKIREFRDNGGISNKNNQSKKKEGGRGHGNRNNNHT